MRPLYNKDKVLMILDKKSDNIALLGGILGLASLFMGWLTLKPNRLASGSSLNLGDSLGWVWGAIIIGLWGLCLAAAFLKGEKGRGIALGATANSLLILTIAQVGISAHRLLGDSFGVARVSISSGAWLTLIGVCIVIYAARRNLKGSPVWQQVLTWSGLGLALVLLFSGQLNHISVLQEYMAQKERFGQELQQHIFLFGISIVMGTLIGIPLGIWAFQSGKVKRPVFFLSNITQTIPSLALFGLLIAPLSFLSRSFPILQKIGIRGIGTTPALIALVIYSLLPIIQNTYTGLLELNPAVIEAGKGMGMNRFRLFWKIELPLAAPLILEGVRTASVQAVGNTAVAALIGAGGLGQFIFQGLGQAASDLVVLGAIPIVVMALLVDTVMKAIVKAGTPSNLR